MKEKQITAITLILLAITLVAVSIITVSAFSSEQKGVDFPYTDAYFNPDTVNTVSIFINEDDWQDMLENPLAEKWHICNIVINGDTYNGTAIRTKGQSTLKMTALLGSNHYSFKIKADEYINGQTFKGLSEFCLNAMYNDDTRMKDYLTYELMAKLGVPTPLHSYAAVYINGEYAGLYLMLESIEDEFAARNFGKNYGQLYKPVNEIYGSTLEYIDDNPSSYNEIFNNSIHLFSNTAASNERVITALKNLDQSTNLEKYFDIKEILKFITGLCSVVALDSYIGKHYSNYYIYEENGKLQIIPWDFNDAFGSFNIMGNIMGSDTSSSLVDFPIDTPVSSKVLISNRPLIEKLLAVDEYKQCYHSYLRWVAENYLDESFSTRIDAIDEMIDNYIKTEPTAINSYDKYRASLPILKKFGMERGKSILGQLNGTISSTWKK